jgi:hypothetical protein
MGLEGDEFAVSCGRYRLTCIPNGLPSLYGEYCKHANLVDQVEPFNTPKGQLCCLLVSESESWPFLVIAQKYSPSGAGFRPGALLVPETDVLFLGAGERLLAYDLAQPKRLWEDKVDYGFHGWAQREDVVLMSAECELAAWNSKGTKLWTALDAVFVEPPWGYTVENGTVNLDIMGKMTTFPLRTGPKKGGQVIK